MVCFGPPDHSLSQTPGGCVIMIFWETTICAIQEKKFAKKYLIKEELWPLIFWIIVFFRKVLDWSKFFVKFSWWRHIKGHNSSLCKYFLANFFSWIAHIVVSQNIIITNTPQGVGRGNSLVAQSIPLEGRFSNNPRKCRFKLIFLYVFQLIS